jgi:predicted O-linked N-acetylglucosamine transferase (SPINDLY family)
MADRFDDDFECANRFCESSDYSAARSVYNRILSVDPDNARALHGLGVVTFRGWGDSRRAVRLIRQALALKSEFADAYNNLAKILQECRRMRAAIACYRKAVSLAPGNQIAWINLGAIYFLEKKPEDALTAFQDAIRLVPDSFEALLGIARTLIEMKRYEESLEYLSRSQELSPDDATVYYSLALAHKQLGHFTVSKANLLRALELKPDYAEAYRGFGDVSLSLGDADGAVEAVRKALALKPDFKDAHTFLLYALHYPSSSTQKDLYDATIEFCNRFCSAIPRISDHTNDRTPDRPLRIGYISGEFNRHPVGFFFEHSLAYHDPGIVTTYCYSNGPTTDWLTDRLKGYAGVWRNIAGLSDETVSRQIQKDEIDILVDLSGHIGYGRIGVMARKPAPVQVSWIGYYNTSGLDTVDYIIMDSDTLPPPLVPWFTERVVYMPESRFCYTPPPDFFTVTQLPALCNHHVTFGCFNNISKISTETIEVWSAILSRMPDALLVLKWGSFNDTSVVERFKAMFELHGIGAGRVEYRGYSDYGTLLEQYGDIDIALDPFPFSGATTTCEALWMGVPVITLPGPLPAGRQTLALLRVIGLPDFIADSKEAYVDLALRHAGDLDALASLRQRIRGMMAMSPLCDGQRFTAELMAAYRIMWQRFCAGIVDEDRKPIEILPAVPEAAYNRGVTCLSDMRWHDARRFFEQAITVNPEFPEAFNNLGIVYYYLGELEAAQSSLENAIRLRPNFVDALNNLGKVLTARSNKRGAFNAFTKVLQLDPDHHQAWCNLGELHQEAGRITKARACFRKSLRLYPDFLEAHIKLAQLYLKYNSDKGCLALETLVMKYPVNVEVRMNMVYAMHCNIRYSRESIFREICKIGESFHYNEVSDNEARRSYLQDGERPLKIGCVSADFHQHPGGVFFQALARHHDKSQFSIICYDNSGKKDMITTDITRHVDHFRCVSGTTDDELVNLIRSDEIDILIDLSGFTTGHRLSVFARKPASVQASWLGWFNSTGMKAIDYVIVDPLMVQAGEERFFVEKPRYLPCGRFCYTPPFLCPDVEPLPALANGYITFGCFNNLAKISGQVVSVWAAILKQAPNSRLVVKSPYFRDYEVRHRFKRRFEIHGVSPERLELRPESLHFFMMSEYNDIDIALDPFPHSGGLTSCETLWMGVPIVTLPGELPVSRQTESFLQALDISTFVARSEKDYIKIASGWAANLELLTEVRANLRERMSRSSICDGKQFSTDFGEVLKEMWKEQMGRPVMSG